MKRLTSRHHPLVAACRALARGRAPADRQILLDGLHLVQEAHAAGLRIHAAALVHSALENPDGARLAEALEQTGAEVLEVSDAVLRAMSPVASPTGLVAIAERPAVSLETLLGRTPRLLLVALDVQDPGNVGAIARAGEAAGVTGFLLCGASADPFGWKALRGSMGSLLRLPAVGGLDWRETVEAVRQSRTTMVATVAHGGIPLYGAPLDGPLAFLLGTEGQGLPGEAVAAADFRVTIPMQPPVESLNVAVAAALLAYEAARRRGKDGLA